MEAFTARNAAKYVVQALVANKTSQIAEDVITDYSRFEEDDIVVDISSHLFGWYVSAKLRPVTDSMVDKTADFIVAKREQMKAKKDNTEEK
jgi:hypothetical protein